MNYSRSAVCRQWPVVALLVAVTAQVGNSGAQSPPMSKVDSAALELKVIPLKHVGVHQLTPDLNALLGPALVARIRMVADGRTNSFFVAATPADFALVKRYVETLDVAVPLGPAAANTGGPTFRVFSLSNLSTPPDQTLEDAVKSLINEGESTIVLDRNRRILTFFGTMRSLQIVQGFLMQLVEAQPEPPTKNRRLRVVWLASGGTDNKAGVPKDLKSIREELSAIGIDDLHLVSQSVIDISARKRFESQGVALLDGMLTDLAINGTVSERALPLELQLSLTATTVAPKQQFCQLSAQIVAAPGQFVVLGVTPTGSTTSVFVVQLLPAAR